MTRLPRTSLIGWAGALVASMWLAVPLAAAEIGVSRRDCQRLATYHAPDDVEYKPGVDVRGKQVAPADLAGQPRIELPDEITIDIGVDFGKRYGIGDSGDKFTSEATIGKVTVQGRRVLFNGQPLTRDDEAALAERCRRVLSGR